MSTSDEKDTMVMVLGQVIPDVEPVEGSVMVIAGCGHWAWMSPRAALTLAQHDDAETKCMACVPAELLGEKAAALPGAIEDAARHLGVPPSEVEARFRAFVANYGGRLADIKDVQP